jgi:outer membrane protein insertion porin family
VDNSFKPHRGWRSYFESEIAGVGGQFRFAKFSYINSLYFPIWRKGTLKLRGDFKYLIPFGSTSRFNTPYSERFFLGGDTTMRGYKPWLFGPVIHLVNDTGGSTATSTPEGGLSCTYLSVEYNQEIFRMLDVFAFVDAGSLSTQIMTFNDFRATVGGGLRLDIGNRTPIMIGWGYVFSKEDRKHRAQPFFFSMGGQF